MKDILTTFEINMIKNGDAGDFFYSEKQDKYFTAISTYYKRKISTQRFVLVTTGKTNPEAINLTKVTLL